MGVLHAGPNITPHHPPLASLRRRNQDRPALFLQSSTLISRRSRRRYEKSQPKTAGRYTGISVEGGRDRTAGLRLRDGILGQMFETLTPWWWQY